MRKPFEIIFNCNSHDEVIALGNKIHAQLAGREDYIKSRILLHLDEKSVQLIVFAECEVFPTIVL